MHAHELIGVAPSARTVADTDTETVRRIARQLGNLEPELARYLAAFAFILSRVAHADAEISREETLEMQRTVERWGGIQPPQAALVVEIAKAHAILFDATAADVSAVTAQFRQLAKPRERTALVHCLFAVSAVDESVSPAEEALVRVIAGELGVPGREYASIRSSYGRERAPR